MKNHKPEVLAIIPARGGSKGIPRKNIVDLCGKPLIAYSIEAALRSKLINRIIVSTEDEEIAEIAMHYGAEVPFLRPTALAGDRSLINDAVTFTLERLAEENFSPDVVAQLYPTHIFRTPKLIDSLIALLLTGYNTVKTVKPVCLNDKCFLVAKENRRLYPLACDSNHPEDGADIFLRPQGLLSATNLKGDQKHNIFLHPITDPISLIDIDTADDLYLAELVINKNLFDFTTQ